MKPLASLALLLPAALMFSGCSRSLSYVWNGRPEPLPVGGATAESTVASTAADPADAEAVPAVADPRAAGRELSLSTSGSATLAAHHLLIPVAGVGADQLTDSFDGGRSGGREHHAIDIPAPRGTPVLAADDGKVLRVSSNTLGGLTVYTIDRSGQFVYYYAHLEGYARGLKAGRYVLKGDTLGFVGTTGDAPENLPHLHFQILRMPPNGHYWDGEPIDPFPLLSASAGIASRQAP
ncbi:MAG TPA: M23 family metallopeptidase [Gemmatimonadaceae bacterium]|nr:M23 family metallopeptidase [Gemmatimonadaceae bacterium]